MTINNTELYNTELYNKALEAIDNFQPIICRLNSGYDVANSVIWKSTDGNNSVALITVSSTYDIYPTSTEDNLYNPKNISVLISNGSIA